MNHLCVKNIKWIIFRSLFISKNEVNSVYSNNFYHSTKEGDSVFIPKEKLFIPLMHMFLINNCGLKKPLILLSVSLILVFKLVFSSDYNLIKLLQIILIPQVRLIPYVEHQLQVLVERVQYMAVFFFQVMVLLPLRGVV